MNSDVHARMEQALRPLFDDPDVQVHEGIDSLEKAQCPHPCPCDVVDWMAELICDCHIRFVRDPVGPWFGRLRLEKFVAIGGGSGVPVVLV